MRVVDFFCGAGGFSEGFRQAGYDVIFAVDNWQPAIDTYKGNKPEVNVLLDDVIRISKLSDDLFHQLIPDSEVIIGSPPCQAFSTSNKSGNGSKELGIALLEAYLRIVARKMFKKESILKFWVLENVPNVRNFIKHQYSASDLGLEGDFNLIALSESSKIYNAKYYGAPTNRKRFLCGHFPEPEMTHDDINVVTLQNVLDSLGEPCCIDRDMIQDVNYPDLTLSAKEITDHHYIYKVQEFEWQKAKRLKLDRGYMGRMSFPENTLKPSRTVMATVSASSREAMILKNERGGYRLPTVREVATIMSFPLDYNFFGKTMGVKYKLVGNSVPPKLSYSIAKSILLELNKPIPKTYQRIHFSRDSGFIDLNFGNIPKKTEKRKRNNAKFKYHIPYMIINGFRVELTNYESIFGQNLFKWSSDIRFSQGKDKAKIYKPYVSINMFNEKKQEILDFISVVTSLNYSHNQFQELYCMTKSERIEMIGPYELLNLVRGFIDEKFGLETTVVKVAYEEIEISIPKKILVGYFLLNSITKVMGEKSHGNN